MNIFKFFRPTFSRSHTPEGQVLIEDCLRLCEFYTSSSVAPKFYQFVLSQVNMQHEQQQFLIHVLRSLLEKLQLQKATLSSYIRLLNVLCALKAWLAPEWTWIKEAEFSGLIQEGCLQNIKSVHCGPCSDQREPYYSIYTSCVFDFLLPCAILDVYDALTEPYQMFRYSDSAWEIIRKTSLGGRYHQVAYENLSAASASPNSPSGFIWALLCLDTMRRKNNHILCAIKASIRSRDNDLLTLVRCVEMRRKNLEPGILRIAEEHNDNAILAYTLAALVRSDLTYRNNPRTVYALSGSLDAIQHSSLMQTCSFLWRSLKLCLFNSVLIHYSRKHTNIQNCRKQIKCSSATILNARNLQQTAWTFVTFRDGELDNHQIPNDQLDRACCAILLSGLKSIYVRRAMQIHNVDENFLESITNAFHLLRMSPATRSQELRSVKPIHIARKLPPHSWWHLFPENLTRA